MGPSDQHRDLNICWLAVSPAPYNCLLFEYLSQAFGPGFQVWFERATSSASPWDRLAGAKSWIMASGSDALWRAVKSHPDLVVISGWKGTLRYKLILWCVTHGIPYVVWTDTPTEDKTAIHAIRNAYVRFISKRARAVMGTGRTAVSALQRMGIAKEKVVNFPYWTIPRASPKPDRWRKGGPHRFACVGRLVPYKGFHFAVEALAGFSAEENSVLHLFGCGPEEDRLREQARTLGVSDRVYFEGPLESSKKAAYLAQECLALIHPATALEPYGVVIIEAMAHGVPVIGSSMCGAVVDRIVHGKNGYVLSSLDATEIRSYMKRMISNPILWYDLSAGALATASEWPLSRAAGTIESLVRRNPGERPF